MNTLPRRRFIAASAAVMTIGATGMLPAHGAGSTSAVLPATLVLYRDNQPASRALAMLGGQAGLPAAALTLDPIRQWRDELGALVEEGWRLAGISNWIDFTIVRGLAAEVRRLPLLVLQPDENRLRQSGIDATAAALLDFALETNADERVRKHALLTCHTVNINHQPRLFAWVI